MKVTKKLLLLGLAMTVLLTMSVPVFALPGNTVVVGNKAFSMDFFFDGELDEEIASAITAGGDIYLDATKSGDNFINAFSGEAITDAQKAGINNIEYKNYDGSKDIYAKFDDKKPVDEEITIISVEAINATTIKVTFSDSVVKNYTVPELKAGENKVTFEYNGITFSNVPVIYTPPVASATKLEKVELINYRYIKVTFSGLVDKASAQDASNYYFEIVDGNADYGYIPTLGKSNQLSEIKTGYAGSSASTWWYGNASLPRHIIAEDIDGKTVVHIYLPEDARFTNEVDEASGNYPYGGPDCERTLGVEMRTSKTDGYILKKLIKDTTVNVAVRNVKDRSGKFTVDTASLPIRIIDEVNPKLVKIYKATKEGSASEIACDSYGDNLGSFSLRRTNTLLGQDGEVLKFEYDEPVFDAHRTDISHLDWYRDITLYVNGKAVASLSRENLNAYMKFEMGNAPYYDAKVVTIDVEKAVKDTVKEQFATGIDYIIHFVGVTDLAGNIEVNSDHTFKVRFYDDQVPDPQITMPKVIDVVQVADNLFRVEFNRAGVIGKFVIENPDGEGQGIFYETYFAPSAQAGDGKFYSYVAVPACDSEDTPGIAVPEGISKEQILAYDGNETIVRKIRVENVLVPIGYDPVARVDLHALDFLKTMVLKDDVSSPVILDPADIGYGDRDPIIEIPVTDIVPYVKDAQIDYKVSPIAYVYNPITESFTNQIAPNQEDADTYLPIRVSYVDADGKTHPAMVSNRDLDPDNVADSGDENAGAPGNITWDDVNDKLILNLSNYEQLLDGSGKLVPGAVYKIEIPAGYFTDSPLDLYFYDSFDFYFGGDAYDILYVDNARVGDGYSWASFTETGLGYTSAAKTVTVTIGTPSPEAPDPEYVPQTSKQLINYDEATNSMKIEFKGTIDPKTLTDKNNYSFNGKTLAQWDAELGTNTVIEFSVINKDGETHQYAIFKIPQDSIQEYGNYEFTVSGVAHPDGAKMVPVTTVVRLQDVSRPVVIDAVQTGLKQIKLTFNEPVRYFVDPEAADAHSAARNFVVKVDGVKLTLETAVLPTGPDSDREITLNLGSVIPSTGTITVEIVKDPNGNILVIDYSGLKNPIKEATYEVTRLAVLE